MKNSGCNCHNCVLVAIIISIIAAITETVLFIIGFFPAIITALLVALTVAILLLLAFIVGIIFLAHTRRIELCNGTRSILKSFVIGIVGTISSVAITLSTHLTNIAQSTIVMVGLNTFTFSLMIISFVATSFLLIDNKAFKGLND